MRYTVYGSEAMQTGEACNIIVSLSNDYRRYGDTAAIGSASQCVALCSKSSFSVGFWLPLRRYPLMLVTHAASRCGCFAEILAAVLVSLHPAV